MERHDNPQPQALTPRLILAQDPCQHTRFLVTGNVIRLTDGEGGQLTGFSAEITIMCEDCGRFFGFRGVPGGYSPAQPMVGALGAELRAPIVPLDQETSDLVAERQDRQAHRRALEATGLAGDPDADGLALLEATAQPPEG